LGSHAIPVQSVWGANHHALVCMALAWWPFSYTVLRG
jgi:hypothetical protein